MLSLIDAVWLLIGASLVTLFLGVIAGFSPSLYIAQASIGMGTKKTFVTVCSLMIGVVGALVFLTILFQFFHLHTLVKIIDATVRALFVSVIFNVFIGLVLILGGVWYLHHKESTKKTPAAMSTGSYAALISFGFFRTFLSISGVTATFIASNIIAEASTGIVIRLLLTGLFLASAVVPFTGIIMLVKQNPAFLTRLTGQAKNALKKINYRPVIGFAAIVFGANIVIFNILLALFY